MFARARGASWKDLYWKIWGRLVSFNCNRCERHFISAEVNFCSFHTEKAKFFPSSNEGVFPCCDAPAIRFDTSVSDIGCSAIPHAISEYKNDSKDSFKVITVSNFRKTAECLKTIQP
jgi:hypothetical protein